MLRGCGSTSAVLEVSTSHAHLLPLSRVCLRTIPLFPRFRLNSVCLLFQDNPRYMKSTMIGSIESVFIRSGNAVGFIYRISCG